MKQKIALVSLLVSDYDEAIDFYTRRLNFTLVEDTKLGDTKRWVRIAPPGSTETCLLLAKAEGDAQKSSAAYCRGQRRCI